MKNREDEFMFEVEVPDPEESSSVATGSKKWLNGQSILRLLRSVGALIIVVSAATFLFKHWTPGSDLQRYLFLLGFTAILSAGGLFCGLSLKESKGARTLLGLTLAVTPINFAVISALLYSRFSWDGPFTRLPEYATWVASSSTMAMAATVGGVALLAPLAHFSFMALARKHAKLFSVIFLMTNGALLLPTRQPNTIALVFLSLVICLVASEVRYFTKEMTLRTPDGFLSRGILWVPALIIAGRSCYFYAPSQLFGSVVLAGLACISFLMLPQLTTKERWQKAFQSCGAALAGMAWLNTAEVFFHSSFISYRYEFLAALLPLASLLLLLGRHAEGNGNNYRRLAAIIAVGGGIINLIAYPGFAMGLICLALAAITVVAGYLLEQKIIFASGVLGCLVAIGYQFKILFSHFSLGSWSSLMVVGVLIIVSASVIERHSGKLREKLVQGHINFKGWGK